MTKSQALQETIDQLRREMKAAEGRRKKLLIDGGDTAAVMEEILAIDLRLEEKMRDYEELKVEDAAVAHAKVSAFATNLVDGLRTMSDARLATLEPPEYPQGETK